MQVQDAVDRFRAHPPDDPDARDIILRLCDKAEVQLAAHDNDSGRCSDCREYEGCRDIKWVRAVFS